MEVRLTLTDKQWLLIEPALAGRPGTLGRSGNNNRMSLEGEIWITRTGAPWRDLPREFGHWNTVHRRFRRWVLSGVFHRIFEVVEEDLDLKTVMVDGTFAKVHQHGTGAKKAPARLMSRLIDKLSAVVEAGLPPSSWPCMVDKTGRLVRFTIRPGNASEAPELTTLPDGVSTSELIADKAYDSDPIRLALASDSMVATIPPRVNRRVQHWYDPIRYRTRHLVENYFCDIKQFRAVATRYNKLADSYCAMVNLASWIIETRSTRRTAKEPVYKPSDKFPAYNTQLPLALAMVA